MVLMANFLRIVVLLLILPQHFCLVRIKMYCMRLSANTYLFFIGKKKGKIKEKSSPWRPCFWETGWKLERLGSVLSFHFLYWRQRVFRGRFIKLRVFCFVCLFLNNSLWPLLESCDTGHIKLFSYSEYMTWSTVLSLLLCIPGLWFSLSSLSAKLLAHLCTFKVNAACAEYITLGVSIVSWTSRIFFNIRKSKIFPF